MAKPVKKDIKWEDLNRTMTDMGYSTQWISRVLVALPRGKKAYSWNVINGAFVELGYSNKNILDILFALKK